MGPKAKLIAALWFFQVANYLDRVVMNFAAPAMMKSLSLSPAAFGVVLSSFSVGYFLAQIPGGIIADRRGVRAVLVIAPLFWALFTGVTGLVTALGGFILARALFGIAEGVSNAACYKLVGDAFGSEQRSRAVAIWSTAFAVAPAFAGPAVGLLLGAVGWRMMFALMMAPALLAAGFNFLTLPRTRLGDQVAAEPHQPFARTLAAPGLWLVALAYFAFNLAYWGYLSWMPSYLALAHHIDLKAMGLLGGIPYVFALLGLLTAGWLGSGALYRLRSQMVACAYLLAAVCLYLAYNVSTLALSVAGLSGAAFFLFGGFGPFGSIVLDLAPPSSRAAFSGVVSTAGQVGGIAAPAMVGFMVSKTGTFAGGFGLMIAGLCVASVCLFGLVRRLGGGASTLLAPASA